MSKQPFAISALSLSLGLASCAADTATVARPTERAPEAPPRTDSTRTAQTPNVNTAERVDVCATIRTDTARVLQHSAEYERLFDQNRERLSIFGHCVHTPVGVWAVVLDDLVPVMRDMGAVNRLDGHWALVHTDPEGEHRVQRSPAMPSVGRDAGDDPRNFVAGHPTSLRIREPVLFDYDGTGEQEAVVIVDEETADQGTVTRGRVWRFSGEAIESFAPARDIVVVATRDADHDDRPDLVTYGPYVGEWVDYCSRHNTLVAGPSVVAHSRADGSFSFADDAAIAVAREACPEDPSPIVVTDSSGAVDNLRTAHNVACARIRRTSAARVIAAVRSGCRHGSRTGDRCVSGCNDIGLLVRWAEAPPPVQLPEPPRSRH